MQTAHAQAGRGSGPSDLAQLLRRVADANLDSNVHTAQVVKTTGREAGRIVGGREGESSDPGPPVLVVVMRGTFVAARASRPYGVPAPRGSVITLILDASTGNIGMFGLNDSAPDLSSLGAVETLSF